MLPSPAKIEAFRSVFESDLVDIADRTPVETRCLILSGGVDTCAILEAATKLGISFGAAFTVVTDKDDDQKSPDGAFATAAAKIHGLTPNHYIIHLTPDELISNYLPKCIKILHTFDGMTLRNSLVVTAAFQKVAELGFKDAIVGDGADELFGGYSFMWGNEDDPAQWKSKRDSMCAQWTFATAALAESFGLTTHSPYTEPKTVKWAIEETVRTDCIGTRPIRLVYGGDAVDHITGKLVLRHAYETVSSWRRKDPIEVGSGVTVIGKEPYWADIISDEQFLTEATQAKALGFEIRTKEYLTNFRIFQECYYYVNTTDDGDDLNKEWYLPGTKRLPIGQGCAGCCFDIGDKMFCDVCGAWPAQRKGFDKEKKEGTKKS